MILEILIAQYKETEEVIKPMLDSIALQQGVDFNDINVIIVNDGSDVILSDEFLKQYPYSIQYYKEEHRGLSATRNALLDHSTGDYLMFCDADDMFLNLIGLNFILRQTGGEGFDLLLSLFMKEDRQNDQVIYYPFYECHVHGKVVRRQFLIDNNIRWKDELIMHDSRYFFVLCQTYADQKRIKHCNSPFYLWKYNSKSITHNNNVDWILETFGYFIYSITCLTDELLKRGKIDQACRIATSLIYATYFESNSEKWTKKENIIYVQNAFKNLAIYYKKYSSLMELNSPQQLQSIIIKIRTEVANRQESSFIEKITFEDWKKMILKLAENGGDIDGNN